MYDFAVIDCQDAFHQPNAVSSLRSSLQGLMILPIVCGFISTFGRVLQNAPTPVTGNAHQTPCSFYFRDSLILLAYAQQIPPQLVMCLRQYVLVLRCVQNVDSSPIGVHDAWIRGASFGIPISGF